MAEVPPGASTWERRIFQLLQSHAEAEEQVQAEYRELATTVDAADVRFLIRLILEDEARHHRWLGQLSDSVKALIEGEPEPEIPWIQPLHNRGELFKTTKRFLAVEQEDAKGLRRILKELHDVEETMLWPLVVRLMLRDTEKHIEILRFIQQRAKG